jgi:hypothetical protein
MDFGISIGLGGLTVLVVGAVLVGLGTYLVGEVDNAWQWLVTGAAAFIGAFVASEWIVGFRGFEPVWDGLALVPALGGGLVVGGIVDFAVRLLMGPTTTHRPMSA